MQIPSYSGTPSEDFVIFKNKFRKAAKDNRISTSCKRSEKPLQETPRLASLLRKLTEAHLNTSTST